MKAAVYNGPHDVSVDEVDEPLIEHPCDVIIRLTSSAICGSDLHMYDGHSSAKPGMILGHEPMGIVEEVGPAVKLVKKGDRVVVPFNIACGACINCTLGFTNACLTMNPQNAGAAYGYVKMGSYAGGQAELLRVPNGDWACLKLPGEAFDELENDFLMLADIFPTGYHATELARVSPGKSVVIFGAGPVGLLAAYSAHLKGASDIYVVDRSASRLKMVATMGAIPINFEKGDPVTQILDIRKKNKLLQGSFKPGEEKMMGVMCGIDAVGYQALDRDDTARFKPNQVLSDLARIVNPGGSIGVVGVYTDDDPLAQGPSEKKGELQLPWGEIWHKGITIGTGQTPVKMYQAFLRDLIISGKAKPGFIVTDEIRIDDVPGAYKSFDSRDKPVKIIIKFKNMKKK